MALKSDGTVWTWGYNVDGKLGDGTNTDRATPLQVIGLTNVVAIAGGGSHSMAR
jgi:alpha-tubulin suppressor-like RCC1 family protein